MLQAITPHLPVLQVIVPLLIAPLCVVFGSRSVGRVLMLACATIMLLITLALLGHVFHLTAATPLLGVGALQHTPLVYQLGGWAAPWGIEYRVDALTVFMLLTINLIHFFAAIFCLGRNDSNLGKHAKAGFYAAWLLCIAGLNGMVVTNDAFNVFVFLEISSLATYVLIACGRDPKALLASFRYLVIGAIGATFILLSIGLLYMQTGTLNITDIAAHIAAQNIDAGANRTIIMALAFFIIGVGIKCAIFPLHDWLPNAYSFAPNSVTVLLSGTATKVALYVLIRFLYDLFAASPGNFQDNFPGHFPVDILLITCAIFGMLLAPIIALRESNLKRMFAWSSVAQIAYIVMAVGLGSSAGIAAALVHIFNHSIIKAAVFMAVGIIIARTGTARIKHLGGIAHKHRLACYAMLFGGLSLIGIPGTVGFVSKWLLVSAAIDKGWWWLTIPILAGSLTSAAYVWRIVETLWAKPATIDLDAPSAPIHFVEWFPLLALSALALWFGFNAGLIIEIATMAAQGLNRGGAL